MTERKSFCLGRASPITMHSDASNTWDGFRGTSKVVKGFHKYYKHCIV